MWAHLKTESSEMAYYKGRQISMKEYRLFTAISRKNVHAVISNGIMGYDHCTVPDTVAVEPAFVAFLYTRKHTSIASRAIFFKFL